MKQRISMMLIGMALALTSCLKENMADCPSEYNVLLRVTTAYEAASRGVAQIGWYEGQIACVTVYVFDENDRFVTHYHGGAYTVGSAYEVPFNLPEGHSYRFVAWSNIGDEVEHYNASHGVDELHDELTFGEMTVSMAVPADRILRSDIPHRHYGALTGATVGNDYELVLHPHTYKVNFILKGSQGQFEAGVTDRNTHHTFDLAHVEGMAAYRHVRTMTAAATRAEEEQNASMILLQIGDDTGTAFDLTDTATGEVLYTADLLETIRASYDLTDDGLAKMLDGVYEYDITFTLDARLDISVDVKAWGYRDNETDL